MGSLFKVEVNLYYQSARKPSSRKAGETPCWRGSGRAWKTPKN